MADQFTPQEWEQINNHLTAQGGAQYGLPERQTDTILFASWNIRKFGAFWERNNVSKRSPGATDLIADFCSRCDLIAIQEVQDRLESVWDLLERLNTGQSEPKFRLLSSDLTGRAPGSTGNGERHCFIYDSTKIGIGEVVSDLSFDQSEILKNVNGAINEYRLQVLDEEAEGSMADRALAWVKSFTGFYKDKLPSFFQFIRAPHYATFSVRGEDGHSYEIGCVNVHLLSGKKIEREREFFVLLEWLLRRSGINGQMDAPTTILFGDLNLDFESDNDARRKAIEDYIVTLNSKQRANAARVNFPFLDTPPGREPIRTNSRENKTFDHIALFSNDPRLPRGRHNDLAGQDGYDYGMFNFKRLFMDAGPGAGVDGEPAYEKFEHDVSDHMPIWMRLPVPSADQKLYDDETV